MRLLLVIFGFSKASLRIFHSLTISCLAFIFFNILVVDVLGLVIIATFACALLAVLALIRFTISVLRTIELQQL